MAAKRRLRTHVHVPQDDLSMKVYGPDDDVPAEDAKKIGEHAWLQDGEEPVTDGQSVGVVVDGSSTKNR